MPINIDAEEFYVNYNNAQINGYDFDDADTGYDCGLYLMAMEQYFKLFLNHVVA